VPALLKLLRPAQWTKNVFVFAPVFFGGRLLHVSALLSAFAAFVAFCLIASSVYCVNDVLDAEVDRAHPEKRNRPVASGAVSVKTAYTLAAACLLLSVASTFFFLGGDAKLTVMAVVLIYYLINIAYCVKLKHYTIIDVVIIAVGFVLRLYAGGAAADIDSTEWIIIMTFLLALFIAFAKRRDDVVRYRNTGVSHRKNTDRYNIEFMDQAMTVVAAITMVAYIMYTLSPEVIEHFNGKRLYFTALFVLMGIIRYLQISIVDLGSGSPEKIVLHDRFIQCCIVGWGLTFWVIIYL